MTKHQIKAEMKTIRSRITRGVVCLGALPDQERLVELQSLLDGTHSSSPQLDIYQTAVIQARIAYRTRRR